LTTLVQGQVRGSITKPILSVLIDTYNHERYIEQAVVSAIEQDFPRSEYEIVVMDDGSTDRTPEIVGKFGPRVRLLSKKNGGQASAFNAALPELRGELVAFLDGDDWWVPGKLATVTTALEQNPGIAGVGHGYYEFNETTGESKLRKAPQPLFVGLSTPEAARKCWLDLTYVHMAAFTVRRSVLDECIPIPETLIFDSDAPIAMAAIAHGALLLDQPLFYYRVHSNNLVGGVDQDDGIRLRRKYEMGDEMFEVLYPLLLRMGVPRDSVSALLDEQWVHLTRHMLSVYGGSRVKAFQTEMRHFRYTCKDPGLAYRLFKYAVVGAATFAIGPRTFYRLRDWYGRQNLGRLREYFATSGETTGHK
jgi:glycosyltransferase involved in cell wall biosynthesis